MHLIIYSPSVFSEDCLVGGVPEAVVFAWVVEQPLGRPIPSPTRAHNMTGVWLLDICAVSIFPIRVQFRALQPNCGPCSRLLLILAPQPVPIRALIPSPRGRPTCPPARPATLKKRHPHRGRPTTLAGPGVYMVVLKPLLNRLSDNNKGNLP